jgi:hypothetical protein
MEYVIATNPVPLSGGTLTLQRGTVNNYKNAAYGTDGQYTYQVIRVPVYYNLILNADITLPSWDGAIGGVLVMAVMNNLNMNGHSINGTGAGFRGGGGVAMAVGPGNVQDFVTVSPTDANISTRVGFHASKGEGIAGTPRLINRNHYSSLLANTAEGYPGGSFGMGAPGNAGGGAITINSGGGGGGNGGAGGKGGNSYAANRANGGYPGVPFAQRSPMRRLVMGGGGGAGDTNDGTGNRGSGLASSGAAGGGIVIISAGAIISPGVVLANGSNANTTVVNDGAGGGGAGGSVLINARSGHSNLTVLANGGNGGINFWVNSAPQHGPGGGGGGGVIYSNGTLAASSVIGGAHGTTNSASGLINYGAQPGAAGITVTGEVMPFPACAILPLKPPTVNGRRNGAVLNEGVLISPVPAISYATIRWSSPGNNKLDITLFNVAGNAVLNRQYRLKRGNNELLLTNLETLPAGIYFVQAYDGVSNRNGKLVIHHNY